MLAIALPPLVLAGGVALAVALVKTAPQAERKPPARAARLVETLTVRIAAQPTVIHADGTVRPALEVTLYPRVSGEIVSIGPDLVPGGCFKEGAELLRIDPRDFELAVRQRQTDVARARAALALEMGQQAVAMREYELLGESLSEANRDLILRKPQLAQGQAAVEAAEAALDLAQLNVERTVVKAPFNGVVRERHVNVGTQVTPSTPLLLATGSDEYWVEVSLPAEQLRWIRVPGADGAAGSEARVYPNGGGGARGARRGFVFRVLPDLEPEGRLARVLVRVPDPLARTPGNGEQPSLLLGDYVSVEIDGIGLPSAVALERRLFRDGDRVWLMNDRNELQIHPVTVGFRGLETMLVTGGLNGGERVVATDLPAAVPGMALREADPAGSPASKSTSGPGGGAGAGGQAP